MAPPPSRPPGLKQRFIAHLTGTPPGEPPLLHRPGTAELLAAQEQAAELCARSQKPRYTPDQRADFQSKSSPLMTELLLLCGRGLHARDAFAQKIGVAEDDCKEAAAQQGALSRLVKAAGDVHDRAAEAAGQVAAEAEQLGEAALGAAAAFVADAAEDPAARNAVEGSFGEAFRLHEDSVSRAGRRELRVERRLRPLRDALDHATSGAAEARLIDDFMSRAKLTPPGE